MTMQPPWRYLFIGIAIAILVAGAAGYFFQKKGTAKNPLAYEAVTPETFAVERVAEELGPVTGIVITPDGSHMLVATLTGAVRVLTKDSSGTFVPQEQPFFTAETGFAGLPEEAGLSGIALGADFAQNGDVFFLYGAKHEDGSSDNKITRVHFSVNGGVIQGIDPADIFVANVPLGISHQIQNGIGVMVEGAPHLLFAIGEGFKPERALDPAQEGGKLLLVQRDGSNPLGVRPYPAFPKVQAVGVRNMFDLVQDPNDAAGRLAMSDTGVATDDRFLYLDVLDADKNGAGNVSLQWDGSGQSLTAPVPDVNTPGQPEGALHRWTPTVTITGLEFYDDASLVPAAGPETSYVLIATFGKTLSTEATPDKGIQLGIIHHKNAQPTLSLYPLIRRSPAVHGQAGHIVGLAVDPATKRIYFGDVVEGAVYEAAPLDVNYSL